MNKNKISTFWRASTLLFFLFFIFTNLTVYAQDKPVVLNEEVQAGESASEENLTPEQRNLLRNNLILNKLRQKLYSTEDFYRKLQKKIDTTQEKLAETDEEIDSLNGEVAYLEKHIQETKNKIINLSKQIAQTEHDVFNIYEDLEIKEIELKEQGELLSDYFAMLYYHKNKFYQADYENVNTLKFILADTSVAQTFSKQKYIKLLEEHGDIIFARLSDIKINMEKKKKTLEIDRAKLVYLNERLKEEQTNLEQQKENKLKLLEDTKGREDIFKQMLLTSIEERIKADKELAVLQTNIDQFSKTVGEIQQNLDPDALEKVQQIKADMEAATEGGTESQNFKFDQWPIVNPTRISAYFDDSGYEKVFGVPHRAVDVPVSQGTPFFAPSDCLIVRVIDTDDGSYNEITCAGEKGVMFRFGHVYQSMVKKGDFVETGTILGLTGGIPGSRGAGRRTTGAHLHFEVWVNGTPDDPLKYLPLQNLPIEYIPAKYLKDVDIKLEEDTEKAPVSGVIEDDFEQEVINQVLEEVLSEELEN